MKKILSLLSMLMITVTAFATSYTDKLTYKLTVFTALTKDLPAGELTIEPYGTSNYTVTAKGCDLSDFDAGNWDEIVCEDVAGTTDANGVTTITLDNPYAYRTSDNTSFSSTKLVVKFNGTKAYAHFEGKVKIGLATRAFEYTFGTDEGFESTGGGSTGGGEDKPAIVDVVDADYAPNGAAFGFPFTINWETQKLVAKLDLSTCSRYTHNEGIITVGTDNGNGDVSLWEPKSGEANCHLYYTRYYYGTDEKQLNLHYLENPSGKVNRVDNSIQNLEPGLVVFTFDKNGLHVGDNLIATPDQMSTLYNSTSLIFGSKEGSTRSNATYKYVKVVPADWTETTEPEVTEVSNKTYTSNLRILDGETTVVEEAEANVNIVKYSDESYKVTLKNVNMLNKTQNLVFVGTAIVEEGPAEGAQPLTIMAKSDEATTTVFGEQVSGTFEITEVSADEIKMGFSMESQNFSYQGEFNYTEEEVEEPEVYTSNLHIYDAAAPETDLFQADQAKVEFLATATGGFKLTLKDVTLNEKTQDLVFTGTLPTPQPGGQEPLAEEGEGEVTPAEPAMVLNATADEATTRFFGGGATYATAVFNVSYDKNDNFMMTFTITAGAKNYGGEFNYEKKTPETPDVTVEVEKTFTDSFSLNNVSLGNAKVTIKEMSDKTINMVFTFGTNDFTSTDLVKGTDDKNRTTYTGTISIGGVECVVNGVVYTKDNAEKLYMTLVSTTSGTYVFGTEPTDTPEPPVVEEYPINFDKDANSTHSSRVLNSFSLQQTGKDKQTKSVKTSKAAYEDHTADEPFTVEAGSELTASFDYTGEWMHSFVYIDFDNDGQFSYKEGQWDQTGTDLVAFSFYSLDSNPKNDASGYNSVGDELTGDARNTYAAPSFKAPAKAGEYRIRFKFDWNCILPGGSSSILSDGGGVWDATLKVVEPVVDGISTINAEVANGETQLFTVNGVKLNKLQNGLNIVRTADGKVKKVLVK
jgi:hypothetical protein